MCTSEARSRMAWVRMRSTTWTTGASSAHHLEARCLDGALPRALDDLEGLDQLGHPTDGPVVVVDGPTDVAQGVRAAGARGARSFRRARSAASRSARPPRRAARRRAG
jgi:hypothetical protein